MQKQKGNFIQYISDYSGMGEEFRRGFHRYLDGMRWGQILPAAIETFLLSVVGVVMVIARRRTPNMWLHMRMATLIIFIVTSVLFLGAVVIIEKVNRENIGLKKIITNIFWFFNIANSLLCTLTYASYDIEREILDFAIVLSIFVLTIAFYSLMPFYWTVPVLVLYSTMLCLFSVKNDGRMETHLYIFIMLVISIIASATRYVPLYDVYSEKMRVEAINGRLKNVAKEAVKKADEANSTKVDFLARISHDMRTPMNGILGLVHLTMQEEISDQVKENLRKMDLTGKYLLNLINDMLDLRKLEEGNIVLKKEPVRTSEFIEGISASLAPTIKEKNIEFKLEQKNVLDCYVNIDRMRLQQVVTNILSNAVKFTPVGGQICVTIDDTGHTGNIAHTVVRVKDSGVGMSEEFQKHLFEPFTQEDNGMTTYAGSGLGMAIVKMLLEKMDATIECESSKGKGTTFTVYIDLELLEDVKPAENVKEDDKNYLQGRRVLVCEDNLLNMEIAKKMLEAKGAIVDTAENGEIGVEKFAKSEKKYYSLILMDIRMPVMNGLEATKNIRALVREDAMQVPILAMSANAFKEDVEASISAGMNAHLTKPIIVKEFYSSIQKAIKEYEQMA